MRSKENGILHTYKKIWISEGQMSFYYRNEKSYNHL